MDSKIIDALGGNRGLAQALNLPASTVANWRTRGVPWKRRAKIAQMLVASGHPVPQEFFGGGV